MVAVEICSTPPLCICSVYMPSRNSKKDCSDRESHTHCLDQLGEILNIYNRTHAVFNVGDMNASLITRGGNLQDALLKDFVDRNALCWRQQGEETFFHPNKADKSEIDNILFNREGDKLVQSVAIEKHTSLNTSDHVPVKVQVCIETREKNRATATTIQVKPKWEKCDKVKYTRFISQNLLNFDTFRPSVSVEMDILQP